MRILVIGGTRFVGKHVVAQALERGHEVTVFHRSRGDLFPEAEHRLGDRNTDLSALAEGTWDATIDTCAYVPSQVQRLADVLEERGGRHLLVSSVSAYAPPEGPGITEDAALLELDDPTTEDVTAETYGGLKVLCERAAVERHGPSTLLVRPTYVVGPDDYTWRFPWWVDRVARGGEIAVPGPPDSPLQVIDARDLGAWMVRLLEDGREGAFHACSPRPVFTWREAMAALVDTIGPAGTRLTWLDPETVTGRLPEGAFPLWGGQDPDVWVMACDPSRAYDAGLSPRPLADTTRDTLAWIRTNPVPSGAGIAPDAEAEVLAAVAAEGS